MSTVFNTRKPLKLKPAYEDLLRTIITDFQSGVIAWKQPWFSRIPTNFHTKKPYHGVNVLGLNYVAWQRGYSSHFWLTERQSRERGGSISESEIDKPAFIILAKWKSRKWKDHKNEEHVGWWLMMRQYRIYNLEQMRGVQYKPSEDLSLFDINEDAEHLIRRYRNAPAIKYDPEGAFYRPYFDDVHIPHINQFISPEEYYSTLFHELVHSTGHHDRLKRASFMETIKFGDEKYANEELIAEIGAAYLCAQLGFSSQTRKNSASYLKSWINALSEDASLLFKAASHAQRACDYILGDRPSIQESQIEIFPEKDHVMAKASPKSVWA